MGPRWGEVKRRRSRLIRIRSSSRGKSGAARRAFCLRDYFRPERFSRERRTHLIRAARISRDHRTAVRGRDREAGRLFVAACALPEPAGEGFGPRAAAKPRLAAQRPRPSRLPGSPPRLSPVPRLSSASLEYAWPSSKNSAQETALERERLDFTVVPTMPEIEIPIGNVSLNY
jgi:hypothetical protein